MGQYSRPRRSPRRTTTSSSLGLVLGLAGGSLLVILLVIGGLVFLVVKGIRDRANAALPGGGPPAVLGPAANAEPGWSQFRQSDGLYSVKLPTSLNLVGFGKMGPFGDDRLSQMVAQNGKVSCDIEVREFSPANLAGHQDLDRQHGAKLFAQEAVRRQVNWAGRLAIEDFDPKDPHGRTRRTYFDGNRMFRFTVSGFFRPLAAEDRARFFDSVVFYPPN